MNIRNIIIFNILLACHALAAMNQQQKSFGSPIKNFIERTSIQLDKTTKPFIKSIANSSVWTKCCNYLIKLGKEITECESYQGHTFDESPTKLPIHQLHLLDDASRKKLLFLISMQLFAQITPQIILIIEHNFLRTKPHDPFSRDSYDLCHDKGNGTMQCCIVHDNTHVTCCRIDPINNLVVCHEIHISVPEINLDDQSHSILESGAMINAMFGSDKALETSSLYKFCKKHEKQISDEARELKTLINFHDEGFIERDYDQQLQTDILSYPINPTVLHNKAPVLNSLITQSAKILNVLKPNFCLIDINTTRAWATYDQTLCLSSGILEQPNPCNSLTGILNHEMGHIRQHEQQKSHISINTVEKYLPRIAFYYFSPALLATYGINKMLMNKISERLCYKIMASGTVFISSAFAAGIAIVRTVEDTFQQLRGWSFDDNDNPLALQHVIDDIYSRYNIETNADIYSVLANENGKGIAQGVLNKYGINKNLTKKDCSVASLHDHPDAFHCRVPLHKALTESYKNVNQILERKIVDLSIKKDNPSAQNN